MSKAKVAIIGAGASGLAAAKALALEAYFSVIDVYDKRPATGGLWNFQENKTPYLTQVPYDDIKHADIQGTSFSPMYRNLETNVSHLLMRYKGFDFPTEHGEFPPRHVVLEYLQKYEKNLPGAINIKYSTLVTNVQKDKEKQNWSVTFESVQDKKSVETQLYDYVVIASGHFEVPRVPFVKGLEDWWRNDRESIIHAKNYVDAAPYVGKKVLVIGNSSSGGDIAIQLSEFAQLPVYVSYRHESLMPEDHDLELVPEVEEYDYNSKSVKLVDGRRITGIDSIVFCTGYMYAFPYLKSYTSREQAGDDVLVESNGQRTRRLYKHIFYIPDPTLTFIGLPMNILPMPMAECQASVVARVYSGRLKLPTEKEMRTWEAQELEEKGESGFHGFAGGKDIDYYQGLIDWSDQAANSEHGFRAEDWTQEIRTLREVVPQHKVARQQLLIGELRKRRAAREAEAQK